MIGLQSSCLQVTVAGVTKPMTTAFVSFLQCSCRLEEETFKTAMKRMKKEKFVFIDSGGFS